MASPQPAASGPPSLLTLAQRACIRDVSALRDVGDTPYHLAYPILKMIENPQQLKAIEDASPHIADHDAELWRAFIARDVPNWQENMIEPKNPRSWWKVHRKLMRDAARTQEASEAELHAALMQLDKEKHESRIQYLDRTVNMPQYENLRFETAALNLQAYERKVEREKPKAPPKPRPAGSGVLKAIRRDSAKDARLRTLGQIHKIAQGGTIGPIRPAGPAPRAKRTKRKEEPPKLPPPKPFKWESKIAPTIQKGWQKKIEAAFKSSLKQHDGCLPTLDETSSEPHRILKSKLSTPPKPKTPPMPPQPKAPLLPAQRQIGRTVSTNKTSPTSETLPSPPRRRPPPATSIFITPKKRTT